MKVCVLGGAGYVGSALVPALLDTGHDVTVLDTFWYGDTLPRGISRVHGDMRRREDCLAAFSGNEAVIHLACVSNDPSFELDPLFGASVNGPDTMQTVVRAAVDAGIRRFIYASSSSVYGVQPDDIVVDEKCLCAPLTDYSRFKLACELILKESSLDWTILRPATVCGWAPRLRLDVVVNAMTASALRTGQIIVHGASLKRPNIHIEDMVAAYLHILSEPASRGYTFNVGAENLTLGEIAETVAEITRADVYYERPRDERSYRIDSSLIKNRLGFSPTRTVSDAVRSIRSRLWHNEHTINIKRMQELLQGGEL